jgi:ribose/xylose/arabinose/galactoside ABC-type transport system permease subunit
VGSVVAISAGVVAMLIGGDLKGNPKYPIAFAMSAAVFVSILAGMWNGMLVSWVGMQPIIATLILSVAGRGIAMVTTNAMVVWLYAKPFALLGQGYLLGLPFSIYMVAVLLLLTWLATRRTALGLFIEAVGINPTASRFAGINAKNLIFWVYAFSGFCAGISGLVVCSTVMSADGNNAGLGYEMDAILAVVIGGTSMNGGKFYLLGSMVGALIVQTLTTTIYAFNVPPEIAQVVKALVVWTVSLLQSATFRAKIAGLFGTREVAA